MTLDEEAPGSRIGSAAGSPGAAGPRRRRAARPDPDARWPLLLLLALIAVALGGCGNSGSLPPGISAAVMTVVTAVWKLRNLGAFSVLRNQEIAGGDSFKDHITEVGQHVKFFLRFRAEAHLAAQPSTDQATQAVAAEYDQMRAFVVANIGFDADGGAALLAGTDKTPGHLDLTDVLRVKSEDGPVNIGSLDYHRLLRWQRAMKIIWRAAALEPDLWTPSFSDAGLLDILDRRLRITERMVYQISQDVGDQGTLVPSDLLKHGPWSDGVRVRMFEYPILGANLSTAIGADNIGPGKIWTLGFAGDDLNYAEDNGRRIRAPAAAEVTPAPGATFLETYPYNLVPGGAAGQALDHLFTPSEDWWDRSWIFCDHVLAALHIESLRFAKLRRKGSDDLFNAAVNAHGLGWAQLRPLLPGSPGDPGLMADDRSKPPDEPRFFANGPVTQLQLGDHVVFWNSIMYGLLSDGAWSLENAIVMDVRSNWTANDIGDSVHLMGHGTADTKAGTFREQLKQTLDGMLEQARQKANAATTDSIAWLPQLVSAPLVRWAPFGELWIDSNGSVQAPWWIRVPFDETPDWQGRAIGRAATLHTLPDAIEYDPAAGFTNAPPAAGGGPANAAYFPLWWPAQAGKWKGYIERRRAGTVPNTFLLEPVTFSRGNIPGLIVPAEFLSGATVQQVYTVRPMVER